MLINFTNMGGVRRYAFAPETIVKRLLKIVPSLCGADVKIMPSFVDYTRYFDDFELDFDENSPLFRRIL